MSERIPSRRELLAAGAALSAVGAALASEAFAQAPAKRPNLILFFPDELRADALGCYGNPVCSTPNYDRLAREGARFENCHVQYPVCGASRCSLLTGWPVSVRGHRSLYYFLRPDEPNLFRYLRQAGYDVFWYGKNDALAQATFPDSVTDWSDAGGPFGPATSKALSGPGLTPGSASMLYPGLDDRRTGSDWGNLQSAIRILERKEDTRPFCIFLPLFNPHPPYAAPKDFQDLYDPAKLPPLTPPGLPKHPAYQADMRSTYHLDKLTDAELRKVRAVYYGQVSYSDWILGQLLEAVERTGHANDTALVVGSDHGDYAGDYGLTEKWPGGLEDCLTHVPMIARIPGGKSGVVASDMVELFDIMPTFLELAGTKATHTHFARSLMPQLHGGPGDPGRAAFTEAGYNLSEPQAFEPVLAGLYQPKTKLQNERPADVTRCAAIRTRTHKLIERPGGLSELDDVRRDPANAVNLIDDAASAKVRTELRQRLTDWYITTSGVPPTDKDPRGLPPRPSGR
ncbi:MAG: sulfatase-like hydrolase/transferase [Proteobacteria bacterium]|nr:sulfatase-like hydrolase/transferase [Pseudomonadota bacterium]